MIFYLGHIVTDIISDQERKLKNKAKSWSYGYDSELDVVIVSKDGTLGEIYNVMGLNIGLPEKPPHKEIKNWDLTAKNQKWKREELPAGLDEETQMNPKYEDFIFDQFKKREEGMWIYIKGKPVWIVGTYWYGIQWVKELETYPDFRVIQNELMIFWEACKADYRSVGMIYVKNRRMGASFLSICELLESGTINQDKMLGIVSKKGRDSQKIFNRLIKAFKRLPPFFKPEWDGTSTPKKELILDVPTKRRGKNFVEEEDGLGSVIEWHNTEINAMDGDAIFRSLLDESAKYPKEVPFDKYWPIVKTSHTKGIKITGKSMVVSTVNAKKKGGQEYENVYKDSDINNRDQNGQTVSGLYQIFIPSRYCLEGMFDVYGFSIVEDPEKPVVTDSGEVTSIGALTWHKNKCKSLQNKPEDLNEFLRQYPETIRDAFRDETGDCSFNLVKILEQEEYNETELSENAIERGNFIWKDGIQDTEVIFVQNPEGRFWVSRGCHPPEEYRNKKERRTINGVTAWAPMAGHTGTIGIDPYNRSKTVDSRGSQGAAHLLTKTSTVENYPNETYIVEYIDRPKTIEMFFEDMIMFSVYYSVPFLCELSNERFLSMVRDRGYRHFSMNNPFKLYKDLSATEKEFGGIPPQDSKIGDQQFYAIEAFVEKHIGVNRGDSDLRMLGEMGNMPFNRTLDQWKQIDVSEPGGRTKFDAYISSSLAQLGNQRRTLNVPTQIRSRTLVFDTYDNSGAISSILR